MATHNTDGNTSEGNHSARAIVVHPDLSRTNNTAAQRRDADSMIEEICGLARAIALDVIGVKSFKLSQIQAGSFLTKGHRESIASLVEREDAEIVIVNHTLSPVQQRNLETAFGAKVIDRTGLILEIFGARAQTKEGRLQVELAAQEYQRSRLVRSWTHLERQRGGAGFMGGPGERQIEIDRRLISGRITKLKKELDVVRRTRELGRKARARVPFPVVALVGYTNAGKSTLFNRLTDSKVFAEDLLFATLDPTLRRLELPNGQTVILSDTVGFISDLPTHLIAAFRATLEETLHADVILHVCDVASPDYDAQRKDVIEIMESLDIEYEDNPAIIEVYNKVDALEDADDLADLHRQAKFDKSMAPISALSGQGVDTLLERVADIASSAFSEVRFELPFADGKSLSWLYEHGDVLNREDGERSVNIDVRLSAVDLARFVDTYSHHPVGA
jgi:GTP-binding protein HflX